MPKTREPSVVSLRLKGVPLVTVEPKMVALDWASARIEVAILLSPKDAAALERELHEALCVDAKAD